MLHPVAIVSYTIFFSYIGSLRICKFRDSQTNTLISREKGCGKGRRDKEKGIKDFGINKLRDQDVMG